MSRSSAWRRALLLTTIVVCAFAVEKTPAVETESMAPATARAGGDFDAAPFAVAFDRDLGDRAYGPRWGEPRKIRCLEVEFAADAALPAAKDVGVQYWQKSWDGRADAIEAETGACEAGWDDPVDDWTRGRWKNADTRVEVRGRRWIFTFASSGDKEFPEVGSAGVNYRKTLKIRLLSKQPLPQPRQFQAFTMATYRPLTVRILWDKPAVAALRYTGPDTGHLEVFNGAVLAVRPYAAAGATPHTTVAADRRWQTPGMSGGIEADVLMAVDPTNGRYDRTVVTVRSAHNPFSFAADETARGDRIFVDDLGALVLRGNDAISIDGYRQVQQQFRGRTVYDRISATDEQTLARAWNDMPLKRPIWYAHGLPGNRNGVHQEVNGDLEITSTERWFALPVSPRDTQRKGWTGDFLSLGFGFPAAELRGGRELLDGYLPQLRTWWVDGPIYYEQCTILDTLDGKLADVRLDDPTVMLMRVRVVNTSESVAGVARLHLTAGSHGRHRPTTAEKLIVQGDQVLAAAPAGPRFRYLLKTAGRGALTQAGNAVDWSLELAPGQSHDLLLLIPTITLSAPDEIAALQQRDFTADGNRICEFWKKLAAEAAHIETPEPWLNDFYKAVLQHLEINCVRDAAAPRRYARVGTFHYGLYLNECVMMITDLDRRGKHQAAAECLQTFLDFQGTKQLEGNFQSLDGLFFGSGGYTNTGYNKSHGCMMWGMAEHWRYTRDRAWMEQAAPKLIKACDWVTRERRATMTPNPDGSRPIEYGFLPTGRLEDVTDYWYWLATNVNTVWGFDALAAALADFGHPEAARLQRDAQAYHADVMRGLNEAKIRTPVVRLRDGRYVPKYPSHLHERGRAQGWIRETLEGSLFLLIDGLIPPDSPEAAWIVKDYEDNLYISDRYGYSVPVFDQYWFSRGGFSMQANLLEGPVAYLYRDNVKHFLRAYFNGFASAFYPEVRTCNEHSRPELGVPFGDYFKSSDESNVTCWLRLMFVNEQGDNLYLGQAIPRAWMAQPKRVGIERAASHFGPLSLWITAAADGGQIRAALTPPTRNPPQKVYLRLRHPQGKPIRSVTLNGRDYPHFDAQKEWIILPGELHGPQEVVAHY